VSAAAASSAFPRSTLVHGNDETGVSALATGIALRGYGRFRWVDCARPAPVEDHPSHWIFARGAELPELEQVDGSALVTSSWAPTSFRELVAPSGPDEERRLASFLSLPPLYQRLGARELDRDDPVAILLANVDALPSAEGGLRLDDRVLHERLHLAGIAVFATAREEPSRGLAAAFDRVYAVEVPAGSTWSHGLVEAEKDAGASASWKSMPLRDAWRTLELDPTLLPPL